MDIIKQDESFTFSEINDKGWFIIGNAVNKNNGSTVLFTIFKDVLQEIVLGSALYKESQDEIIELKYTIDSTDKNEFINYSNYLIDLILEKMKS